jgi:heterodisulfide reductase subunit C
LCPSGIDLQDLWQASQHDLARCGYLPPHKWIRSHTVVQWAESLQKKKLADDADAAQSLAQGLGLTDNPDTFWACVQCTTCTNVCPVVAASDNPRQELDLTPQQVMNLMRLELKHMALGCRMVWDCVTCYKCQEHCPQGVPVADVLYELRNEACRRLTPETGPPKIGPIDRAP